MFQVDGMWAVALVCQPRVAANSTYLHVLVSWILSIANPEGLDSADAAIRTYIASEATAGNHLTQTIDVCTIRQC